MSDKNSKRTKPEVYSRIVGYLRPVQQWNEGKSEEFKDRKIFNVSSKTGSSEKNFGKEFSSQNVSQEKREAVTPTV